MKQPILILLLASAGLSFSSATAADGDAAAGKAKSATCMACHGADGNSVNPEWPSLAGQHESYTIAQLQAFKSGKRNNALMSPMSMGLSAQDMADLAAFYAAQKPKPGKADPDLVSNGQRIYRGGDPARGVPACIACHGPSGDGNPMSMYPRIAGQHATYSYNQLKAYANLERKSDKNQMMRNIADRMSDADMRAVASYMQGLR